MSKLDLSWLAENYAVFKLELDYMNSDLSNKSQMFSLTRTSDELSLACTENLAPKGAVKKY